MAVTTRHKASSLTKSQLIAAAGPSRRSKRGSHSFARTKARHRLASPSGKKLSQPTSQATRSRRPGNPVSRTSPPKSADNHDEEISVISQSSDHLSPPESVKSIASDSASERDGDPIIQAVINLLSQTPERPWAARDLSNELWSSQPIVHKSANPHSLIYARLNNYINENPQGCLCKIVQNTRPRKAFFFLRRSETAYQDVLSPVSEPDDKKSYSFKDAHDDYLEMKAIKSEPESVDNYLPDHSVRREEEEKEEDNNLANGLGITPNFSVLSRNISRNGQLHQMLLIPPEEPETRFDPLPTPSETDDARLPSNSLGESFVDHEQSLSNLDKLKTIDNLDPLSSFEDDEPISEDGESSKFSDWINDIQTTQDILLPEEVGLAELDALMSGGASS